MDGSYGPVTPGNLTPFRRSRLRPRSTGEIIGGMSAVLQAGIPPAPGGLPETFRTFQEAPKQAIKKINYSHDAMIDLIVANPGVSQGELARAFGYTEGWVSQVIASDAFQSRLAARKDELIDPTIRATIEERFKGLVYQSLAVLRRKLETNPTDDLVLRSVEIASKALGYGARGPLIQQNNNFVVQMPGKASSSKVWEDSYTRAGAVNTEPRDVTPSDPAPVAPVALPATPADRMLEELGRAE